MLKYADAGGKFCASCRVGNRRINVSVAPLEVEEFRRLKEKGIGTYQLFQETYRRETYARVHLGGRKQDYDWRFLTQASSCRRARPPASGADFMDLAKPGEIKHHCDPNALTTFAEYHRAVCAGGRQPCAWARAGRQRAGGPVPR